jgi:hypothetical protein
LGLDPGARKETKNKQIKLITVPAKAFDLRNYVLGRVSDPDPDWIRIPSSQWIGIRIQNPDPDPGRQK